MEEYYLDKISLKNYRCFIDTSLKFKDLCIIVGKNNAGKSTLIEALRLISAAGKKSNKVNFTLAPAGMGFAAYDKGIKLDVDKLKIDLRSIVYFYHDKVATLTAFFKDKTKIEIHLNTEIAFACLYDNDGQNIKKKSIAAKFKFNSISILPQIGLIKENEKLLAFDTIKSDEENYLSSRHFRNELWINRKEKFSSFIEIAMMTWEGLRIEENSLSYDAYYSDFVQFIVQDAGFPAEIGLMGSGIQMWLQIIWFVCKAEDSSTVILDEPDVYMHPDLQIKLLRLVKNRFPQVIIATHSVEIISDVDANNIVLVDKEKRYIQYANDSNAVQSIIDSIGGVQNLSLMRIGNSKKCLFVEGNDMDFLSRFSKQMEPNSIKSIKDLPCISLGGKANLSQAYGASELFFTESQGVIQCICILDSDYQSEDNKNVLIEEAASKHLYLHIWNRKEIENYLLNPKVLFRIVSKQNPLVTYEKFSESFNVLIDAQSDDVFDRVSTRFKVESGNKHEVSTCNKMAREYLAEEWTSLEHKIALVKGKFVLPKMIEMLKNDFSVRTSEYKIISEFTSADIDDELKEILVLLGN